MEERAALPNAVNDAHDFWLWLDLRVRDLPTAARHTVGARMLTTSIDLLELLIQATYARRGSNTRHQSLARANVKLALLRLLVRGCRDRHYISIGQYEQAIEKLVALGKLVGAWLKSAQPPPEA